MEVIIEGCSVIVPPVDNRHIICNQRMVAKNASLKIIFGEAGDLMAKKGELHLAQEKMMNGNGASMNTQMNDIKLILRECGCDQEFNSKRKNKKGSSKRSSREYIVPHEFIKQQRAYYIAIDESKLKIKEVE
nr:hypothetical protein [Tanacetum cinerariifolium]